MAKVADIIRDALGHLRVIGAQAPVAAEDARDAIRALNLLVRGWEVDGISLGWQDVTGPDDELPVPPEAEEALGFWLAIRLRARYGQTLDADVYQQAEESLARLRTQISATTFERMTYPDLPAGEGQAAGRSWRDGFFR